MAKRRKAKKSYRKSRRVGAVSSGLMEVAQLVLGGVASQFAGGLVEKLPFVKDQSEKVKGLIKGALPVALGMALPKMVKGTQAIGKGMIVGGGISLVRSTGLISGIGALDFYANKPTPKIAGYQTGTAGNYIAGYMPSAGNYIAGLNVVGAVLEESGC